MHENLVAHVHDHQNVVGEQFVLINMRAPPTHYYLESSGQMAYMETHT